MRCIYFTLHVLSSSVLLANSNFPVRHFNTKSCSCRPAVLVWVVCSGILCIMAYIFSNQFLIGQHDVTPVFPDSTACSHITAFLFMHQLFHVSISTYYCITSVLLSVLLIHSNIISTHLSVLPAHAGSCTVSLGERKGESVCMCVFRMQKCWCLCFGPCQAHLTSVFTTQNGRKSS